MKHIDYRKDIDGLRAIAVISVIIYHLNNSWLSGGFLGVDIFLVISGFIMTKIIFSENFDIISFYINRLKRILPAFLFILILVFIFGFLLYSTEEWEIFTPRLKKSLIFILNNFYSSKEIQYGELSFFDPLMHTWSLGLEMQFYVLYSIVLIVFFYIQKKIGLFSKINNLYILLAFFVISLFIAEIFLKKNMDKQAFYLLIPRVWEFIAGGFIALISNKITKDDVKLANFLGLIGLLLIAISLIFIKYNTSLGLKSIAVVLGSALIILSGSMNKTSYISRFLSLRYVVFIGLISYSLYLWHWPIIAFAKQIYGNDISIYYLLLIGIASFLLAYLTYKFIEKPFRDPKFILYKSIGKLLFKPYKIITLILIFLFIGFIYYGFNYLSKLDRGINFEIEKWHNECELDVYPDASSCKYYSKENTINFLLLGNSLTTNNRKIAEYMREEYNLGFYHSFLANKNFKKQEFSNLYMKNLIDVLNTNNIKFAIIAYHFNEQEKHNFILALDELKKRKIKIIVLEVTPGLVRDPRICLTSTKLRIFLQQSTKNNCFEIIEETFNIIQSGKNAAKKYNALYLETLKYFDKNTNYTNYYSDRGHFNMAGRELLFNKVKDDYFIKIIDFIGIKNK